MSVNTDQIHELAKQIRNNTDPETVELLARQHVKSLTGLSSGIVQNQSAQMQQILPVMKLPSANPTSIVTWLGKLVAGYAAPQMQAYIKYTVQLTELSLALTDLLSAVSEARGNIDTMRDDIMQPLHDVRSELDMKVNQALSTIDNAGANLNAMIGLPVVNFDTSSPEGFLNSVTQNSEAFASQLESYLNTEEAPV